MAEDVIGVLEGGDADGWRVKAAPGRKRFRLEVPPGEKPVWYVWDGVTRRDGIAVFKVSPHA